MATELTDINVGASANDGSGDELRSAGIIINDNFDKVYSDLQAIEASQITAASLVRAQLSVSANGAEGQVIAFSSQFVVTYAIQVIDYNGIGIEVTAQDQDGFTITSLKSGNFGYIALIEN